jgi:HD-GYP domain-containing protein (c-di-GMP phosphodiesterase class II)
MNLRSGCEAADVLAARLGMTQAVRDALACTFERWNGEGQPNQVKGERIPVPMRIVHLVQDAEALARLSSPEEAVTAIQERSGRAYDPDLVDEFVPVAAGMFARLDKLDPWDAALACEPEPRRVLDGAALDEALEVVADFTDPKSPFTAGHSRRVAALTVAGCERAGLPPAEVRRARRAGLAHDLGRTATPNSVWDKPGPLTRAERDRVQLHPALTDKMLRRAGGLDALNPVAACHHEYPDDSGYFKGLASHQLSPAARILGAADGYQAMTQRRVHRTGTAIQKGWSIGWHGSWRAPAADRVRRGGTLPAAARGRGRCRARTGRPTRSRAPAAHARRTRPCRPAAAS